MKENIIKTILLITNLCMWISGWAVLAVGVYMMSGDNGRHFTIILLGDPDTSHSNLPLNTPTTWSNPSKDNFVKDKENGDPFLSSVTGLGNSIPQSQDPLKLLATNVAKNTSFSNFHNISGTDNADSVSSSIKLEAILLAIGSVIVMGGLVGCIASSQNDKTLMLAYCILMIIVGAGNGIAGIWCLSNTPQTLSDILPPSPGATPPLQRIQQWYGSADHVVYTQALDTVQDKLSCCGLVGPEDYATSYWHRVYSPGKSIVPPSCCQTSQKTSTSILSSKPQCENGYTAPNQQGCLDILPGWVSSDYVMTGVILIILSTLQIAGATLTLVLRKKIKTISCGDIPPINTLLF